MSNVKIHIVGILRPKLGKLERFIEVIYRMENHIQAHEKDITRFSVSRDVDKGANTLVLVERYESQSVLNRHIASPEYVKFQATLKSENIIDFSDPADVEFRVVSPVVGFM